MIERFTLPVSAESRNRMMRIEQLKERYNAAKKELDDAITNHAVAELRTLDAPKNLPRRAEQFDLMVNLPLGDEVDTSAQPSLRKPLGTKVKSNRAVSNNSRSVSKRLRSQGSV